MGQLGISLYPEKTNLAEDQAYLDLAKKYHFSRIFMNLLLYKVKEVEPIIKRIQATIDYGNQLGFETYIDVNPYTLESLKIKPTDLFYFSQMGVKGIRLDMGFSGKEEAAMTKNPYGLKIEINMSNDDHYLERIFDYNPKRDNLVGCHNFFPQAYTGLEVDYFVTCSKRFLEKNLKSAAFVTSPTGEVGPWTLHEGLCTLEAHRNLPIGAQVKHLQALGVTDDIIIGNAYASESELKEMSQAFKTDEVVLRVVPQPDLLAIEREIIEGTSHTYRGDRSAYMIRSSMPRFTYMQESVLANHTTESIKKGDVLILNQAYAQYKAELQIALKARPEDQRINKVGRIHPEDLLILATLKPYTTFSLVIVAE